MPQFAILRQCWSFKRPHQNCVKLNLIFIIHVHWTAGEVKDPHKNCDGLCNFLHSYVFLQECDDWCAKYSKNHVAVFRNFAKQEECIASCIFKSIFCFSLSFLQTRNFSFCQIRVILSCIVLSFFSFVLCPFFILKGQVTVTKNPLLCLLRQEYFSVQWLG